MSVAISGSGTITGLAVGGLPDGVITAAELAPGAAGMNGFNSAIGTAGSNTTVSWTAPTNVTKVLVFIVGGGGGAGFTNASNGGGSGSFAYGVITVVPGTTYTITAGRGGPTTPNNTAAIPGGTSSFGNLATATGGGSAAGGTTGFSPGAGGTASGAGLLLINGVTGGGANVSPGGIPFSATSSGFPSGTGKAANSSLNGDPGVVLWWW